MLHCLTSAMGDKTKALDYARRAYKAATDHNKKTGAERLADILLVVGNSNEAAALYDTLRQQADSDHERAKYERRLNECREPRRDQRDEHDWRLQHTMW